MEKYGLYIHWPYCLSKCPYCGNEIPVFWNGNYKFECMNCHKKYKIHRTKLTKVKPYVGTPPTGDPSIY